MASRHGLSDLPARRVWSFQERAQNLPSKRSPSLLQLYGTVCRPTLSMLTVYCLSKNIYKLIYTNAPTTRNLSAKRLWICVNTEHMALYKSWFDLICSSVWSHWVPHYIMNDELPAVGLWYKPDHTSILLSHTHTLYVVTSESLRWRYNHCVIGRLTGPAVSGPAMPPGPDNRLIG